MKISKLSNNIAIFLFIIYFFFFNIKLFSQEPVDIWKLENQSENKKEIDLDNIEEKANNIFKSKKNNQSNQILQGDKLPTDDVVIIGLYDPEKNGLDIDMWTNSDGLELRNILNKIQKLNLSSDASEILKIAMLTNSYFPEKNITFDEFLNFKMNYLIQNNDLNLIKDFLIKNNKSIKNGLLVKYYTDEYLSFSDIESACSIFNEIDFIDEDYFAKFKIYCLINDEKKDEAQLLFDLKKELGFEDIFFEKKFNLLMGYQANNDKEISDKNIFDFHLSHRTDADFFYKPNENTPKNIWKYLSSANLLENIDLIDLEDEEKIKIIEKATHERNYTEKELFSLYKRFQFKINQLLTVKETYKLLPNFMGRALLYQRLILTIDAEEKLDLSFKLKKSFIDDNIGNAFEKELSNILKEINIENVPSNYSSFYDQNIFLEKKIGKKIKYNNKFIHQSKLINYFINKTNIEKIEKDTNEMLKKIKKDKKYVFTTKDIMLVESLKSDGVKILKKYENLYDVNPDIPADIQLKLNNKETGMVLLRIVEIIGEDNYDNLGTESLNLIISVLNTLNMDKLRNKILLKVLPLKV